MNRLRHRLEPPAALERLDDERFAVGRAEDDNPFVAVAPAKVKQAASLAKQGITVSLEHPLMTERAADNGNPLTHTMTATGERTGATVCGFFPLLVLAHLVPPDAAAWKACGYHSLRDFVNGIGTLEAVRWAILVATRQYAKRQRTWFRHQLGGEDVTHIDPRSAGAAMQADRWWREEIPA